MSEPKTATDIIPILLAAGKSQRFGSDKLLVDYENHGVKQALILHVLQRWLSVFKQLTLVTRNDNINLIKTIENSDLSNQVNIVFNSNYEQGMSTSLVTAIKANPCAKAWIIGLADMPFISQEVLQRTHQKLRENAKITQPYFEQRPGHPVGFCHEFYDDLINLSGDVGAKSIISNNKDKISFIQSNDDGILVGIDTKAALIERLAKPLDHD